MAAQGNLNSNIITLGDPAKFGVYPQNVTGTLTFSANNTVTSGELYTLCKIPAGTYISDFIIDLPNIGTTTVTVSLQDDAATPVVYVANSTKGQAGGIISASVDLASGKLGTVYAAGTTNVLNLKATATAGSTVGGTAVVARFKVQFSPV